MTDQGAPVGDRDIIAYYDNHGGVTGLMIDGVMVSAAAIRQALATVDAMTMLRAVNNTLASENVKLLGKIAALERAQIAVQTSPDGPGDPEARMAGADPPML